MPKSFHFSVSAAVLISISLSIYIVMGASLPRPLWFTFAISLSMAFIIASSILVDPNDTTELISLLASGLLVSFVSKSSNLLVAVSSGIDHGRWLGRVEAVSQLGTIVGGDMYEASPIYILELSISSIIFGDSVAIATSRFVTILIAAAFPLLIYSVLKKFTGSRQMSLLGFSLAITQPLLFRTAMLLESEILAMVWYSIALLSFIVVVRTQQIRWVMINSLFLSSSILLHFLYGFITITTLSTAFFLILVLSSNSSQEFIVPNSINVKKSAVYLVLFSIIFAPFWIFGSTYQGEAVAVLSSIFTIDGGVLTSLIPTEGSAAAGTGNSDNTGMLFSILKYTSISGFLFFGIIGGIRCLIARCWEETVLAIISLMIAGMSAVAVAVGLDFRLGFRFYYYVLFFLLLLSPIGIDILVRSQGGRKWVPVAQKLLFVGLVLGIVFSAPISPIANNIDPAIGGEMWYILPAEQHTGETMGQYVEGEVPWSTNITQHHEYFRPHSTPSDPTRLTRELCKNVEEQIVDNGYMVACRTTS